LANWRRALAYLAWYAAIAATPLVAGALLGQYFNVTNGKLTSIDWGKFWDGYWGWILLTLGLLGTIAFLHFTRGRWKTRQDVQTDLLLENLRQSARYIADAQHMTPKEQKGELSAIAVHLVQALVRSYPEVEDVRATIYRFNEAHNELRVYKTQGKRLPTGPFRNTDKRGKAAIKFALTQEKPELIADTKHARKGYRCYISAPILSVEERYGMLTVDAKAPFALSQADELVVWTAANLFGIIEASIYGRVSQPRDTVGQNEGSGNDEDGKQAENDEEASVRT
jgi:hypothetical protein